MAVSSSWATSRAFKASSPVSRHAAASSGSSSASVAHALKSDIASAKDSRIASSRAFARPSIHVRFRPTSSRRAARRMIGFSATVRAAATRRAQSAACVWSDATRSRTSLHDMGMGSPACVAAANTAATNTNAATIQAAGNLTRASCGAKNRSANGTSASVGRAGRIMRSNIRDRSGWMRPTVEVPRSFLSTLQAEFISLAVDRL